MSEYDDARTLLEQQFAEEGSSVVAPKDRWKLRKPHPFWRMEIFGEYQRQNAWQELSEGERLKLSDELGPRQRSRS